MKKIFYRICSAFIWNKEKRRDFRNKHSIFSERQKNKKCFDDIKILLDRELYELLKLQKSIETMDKQDVNCKILETLNLLQEKIYELPELCNRIAQINMSTALLHQKTFIPFKGKHTGNDIVIVATGPTAKKYKKIPNAIHIGVNRAIDLGIELDYLFIQDYSGATDYLTRINSYRSKKCIKFYGLTTEYEPEKKRVIPETDAIQASAFRYRTDWMNISGFAPRFAYDISAQPLGCFGTIVFPALQFALWTNPRRIYLVGCDVSRDGYFDNEKLNVNYLEPDNIIHCYKKFKDFAKTYYPSTEIISINPVGLKGIFNDVYQ